MRGPTGLTGAVGATGPAGATGATGATGPAGSNATVTASAIQSAGGALLASPAFSGAPTAPTQTTGDSSTDLATDGFVANAVAGITSGASGTATAIATGGSSGSTLALANNTTSFISTPSSTGNDMPASEQEVIDIGMDAPTASSGYPQIVGKWDTATNGSAAEFTVYTAPSGVLSLGGFTPGNGSYVGFGSFGSLVTGAQGTMSIAFNFSTTSTLTAHGVVVPKSTVEELWSTNYNPANGLNTGTWTIEGATLSVSSYPSGFAKHGASGDPLMLGALSNQGGSMPMTVYSFEVTDGAGNILANPNISGASGTTIPTDAEGNVWTLGSGATITPGTSATLTGAQIQTAVTEAAAATTTLANGVSASPASVAAAAFMAPAGAGTLSPCTRAGAEISPVDYGATGAGYQQTIGTKYGTSLAAIAGYTTVDCTGNSVQPFAWLTNANDGGVVASLSSISGPEYGQMGAFPTYEAAGATSAPTPDTAAALVGDTVYDDADGEIIGNIASITAPTLVSTAALSTSPAVGDTLLDEYTRDIATVSAVSGTTYTLSGNPFGFVAGDPLEDTTNSATGTISSFNSGSFGFASGILKAINAGDTFVTQHSTTATAAGSTSSTSLTVGANFGAPAGWAVYDSTQAKEVGTISSISSTTGVTLAANASVAVASGDNLSFFNPSVVDLNSRCQRCGYPSNASSVEPIWANPQHESFYPQVGNSVTDNSNSTPCIPAGDTISAIDNTPTDANYGKITLTTPLTYDCPFSTDYVIEPTPAQLEALSVDFVGLESAIYAATHSGFSTTNQLWSGLVGQAQNYRTVHLPDFELYPERPVFGYSYASSPGNHLNVVGDAGLSVIDGGEYGANKFVLSAGSGGGLNQGCCGVEYRNFSIVGPGSSGVGSDPGQGDGLGLGAGDEADNVTVTGEHAGFGFYADHNFLYHVSASGNFYGVEFLANTPTMGNQRIENSILVANHEASIAVADSNQWDSGSLFEVHVGFGPFGYIKEPAGAFDPYPGTNTFLSDDNIISNWWESTGNGAIVDFSGHGQVAGDTFVGAETNNDYQYAGEALPGTALGTIRVSSLVGNRFQGYSILSDYGDVSVAPIDVSGACSGNLFIGADQAVANGSSSKPMMACGSEDGSDSFIGEWNGSFQTTGAAISKGAPVSLYPGGIEPYSSTYPGYIGVAATSCAAGSICPVIRNGGHVTIAVSSGTANGGTTYAPSGSSSGEFGAASGFGSFNAVSDGACTAGQTCTAELR